LARLMIKIMPRGDRRSMETRALNKFSGIINGIFKKTNSLPEHAIAGGIAGAVGGTLLSNDNDSGVKQTGKFIGSGLLGAGAGIGIGGLLSKIKKV